MIGVSKITVSSILIFLTCSIQSAYALEQTQFEKLQSLIESQELEQALARMKIEKSKGRLTKAEFNILSGLFFIESGRPNKAIQLLEDVSFQTTQHESAINSAFARAYWKVGDLVLAEIHAEKALRFDSSNLSARILKNIVEGELAGQVQVSDFENLLRQAGDNLQIWLAYLEQTLRLPPFQADLAERAYIELGDVAVTKDYLARYEFHSGEPYRAYEKFQQAQQAYQEAGNAIAAAKIGRWLDIYARYGVRPDAINPEPVADTKIENGLAKQEEVIGQDLKPAVVEDELDIDPISIHTEGDVYTGSGFITNGGQWIVTNRHVIEGADRALVRDGIGKVREVSEYYLDEDQDIAVLVLAEPFPEDQSVKWSDIIDPVGGDELFLMGYPLAGLIGTAHPSITEGIVSKESGFDDDFSEFLITANLNQGNSGGPIFAPDGRVLGIAVAKLDKTLFLEENDTIPEDVNIGIKGREIRRFLDYTGPINREPRKILSARDAYSQLRSQVVFIVAVDD